MYELKESSREIRALIEGFLQERFDAKAEKLAPDDPKRDALAAQFQFDTWIADAAKRVESSMKGENPIKIATHTIKAVHPDAKGANLFVNDFFNHKGAFGSDVLDNSCAVDIVGNAAYKLNEYKFLLLRLGDGRSLIDLAENGDQALADALSRDKEEGRYFSEVFSNLKAPLFSSSSKAKQIYWLVGDDPTNDASYHLLAPLYATSLAHRVFQTINEDRFGESARQARQARREGRFSEQGYHDYPDLAVQKLGGTKPQNISQLNSERGGNNYLLASLPPRWISRDVKAPLFTDSVFPRFGRHREVRWLVSGLRRLLISDPAPNRETRDRRDEYVGALIDELVIFASAYGSLEPGWSADPDCRLAEAEALWLDPYREDAEFLARRDQGDWPQEVRQRFAGWLNHQLADVLPVGDAEHQFWVAQLKKALDALQEVLPHV